MSQFLEAVMVVLFGISWPLNIMKSVKSRTAKGKSLPFLIFIWVGYIAGIASKLVSDNNITYVFFFYVLNLVMVSIDFCLYFRNVKLDKEREAAEK